ncbi:hypothetical protein PR003_g32347 [Phytophthora rubi]|uniref:Uncharacterized protein n=1 Tax=Phytophthora rubi TaxID=129364 RepID=A0A6A4B082_9STRA|nr:hypothetical protein PR003_g32347 [Phytophthora rubi]
MTTSGGTVDRDQRAQRRAASVERAAAANAAKQQLLQPGPTTVTTLETEDGATVTLSTEEIRRASGNTPVAAGGSGQRDLGSSGGGDAPAGQGDGSGGDGGGREDSGSQQSNTNANANTSADATTTAASGRGPTQVGAPQRPIIVREKAKTLKLKKFKGLDDTVPVTMWLKTVRAEVRRQAVSLGVTWQEKLLYHEVASKPRR